MHAIVEPVQLAAHASETLASVGVAQQTSVPVHVAAPHHLRPLFARSAEERQATMLESPLFAAAAEAHHIPAMPEVDAAHFPRLAEALELAPSDEDIFKEGLQVLLAGLRARYGSR